MALLADPPAAMLKTMPERVPQLQLDPESSSVQFHDAGQLVGWAELPQLPIGFVPRSPPTWAGSVDAES